MVYPAVSVDFCLLVDLEFYLFGKTLSFSLYFSMQVVPILYTVQDRNIPEEQLKPELCSTTCTWCVVGVTPPSWTSLLAARNTQTSFTAMSC